MNRPPQPNRSRNIIFVGMPCSGKTTFGKVYAARTRRQFIDFDAFVESHASRTIPEIFATEGEAGFRAREQKCLRRLEKKRGAVISMGGGTLCNPANLRFALNLGLIVFLATPLDEVAKRAFRERGLRPLFASCASEAEAQAVAERLWGLRRDYYEAADLVMETHLSSLDNLTLQLLSCERRANSILQRRQLPKFLLEAAPLPSDQTAPAAAIVTASEPARAAPPVTSGDTSLPSSEAGSAEAAQTMTLPAAAGAASETPAAETTDGPSLEGTAPATVPAAPSRSLTLSAEPVLGIELPRPPAETWDDVLWKVPEEQKPDTKVKEGKKGPRPEQRRAAGGDDGGGRNRKRRGRPEGEGAPSAGDRRPETAQRREDGAREKRNENAPRREDGPRREERRDGGMQRSARGPQPPREGQPRREGTRDAGTRPADASQPRPTDAPQPRPEGGRRDSRPEGGTSRSKGPAAPREGSRGGERREGGEPRREGESREGGREARNEPQHRRNPGSRPERRPPRRPPEGGGNP